MRKADHSHTSVEPRTISPNVRYWGEADMPRPPAGFRSVAYCVIIQQEHCACSWGRELVDPAIQQAIAPIDSA
jgi:hypothetical protein